MGNDGDHSIDMTTVAKLRSWVSSNKQQSMAIELDTDLIGEGALDSLQMVNFVLYIEEMRGREIPEALMKPEYFVSLRVICGTFFATE